MTPHSALRLFPAMTLMALGLLAGAAAAQQHDAGSAPPSALDAAMEPAAPAGDLASAAPSAGLEPHIQNVVPLPPEKVPDIDPLALYGGALVFDVYRKGAKIGQHVTTFTRTGEDLRVDVRMNLAVDVLFITAYKFDYEATEIWRDGQLIAASSTVNDNGKIAKTAARLEDGVFKVDGPRGAFLASDWVFPTNHWHRGQANSGTLLNTLNGRLVRVDVAHRGIDAVATAQGSVDAEHLEYTGQLRDTEVWYDADNRWVKMRFKAKDGSYIEHRCRQCGLAPGAVTDMADNAPPGSAGGRGSTR